MDAGLPAGIANPDRCGTRGITTDMDDFAGRSERRGAMNAT